MGEERTFQLDVRQFLRRRQDPLKWCLKDSGSGRPDGTVIDLGEAPFRFGNEVG